MILDWPTLASPNRASRLLLGKTQEGWLITFGADRHNHLGTTAPTWDPFVQVTNPEGEGHHCRISLKDGDKFEDALREAIEGLRGYMAHKEGREHENRSRRVGDVRLGVQTIEGTFDTEEEGIIRRLGLLAELPADAEPVIKTDKELQLAIGLGFQEVWPVTVVEGKRRFRVWVNMHKPTMPTLDRPGDEIVRHVVTRIYWTVHIVEIKDEATP